MIRKQTTAGLQFNTFHHFSSLFITFTQEHRDGALICCLALTSVLSASGCARRFAARGMILSLDLSSNTVLVSHRDIPHYMPAMSMSFHARAASELAGLYPGAQVEFQLVARKSGSYIQNLRRIGGGAVIEDQGDRITLPPNPD